MSNAAAARLIYLSYGRGAHTDQITFSVLSAMRFDARSGEDGAPPITIFSDDCALYTDLPVELIQLDADRLEAWRGPHGFNHVLKLEVLRLALEQYGVSCIFIDADTYFLRHPRLLPGRVSEGRSLMHLPELRLRPVTEASLRSLADVLFSSGKQSMNGETLGGASSNPDSSRSVRESSGEVLRIPKGFRLWNAGVLGISPAERGLLGDAIHLTHEVYIRSRSHVAEQFSMCYYLTRQTTISAAADVVFHYWPYLYEFDRPGESTEWARRVPELVAQTRALSPDERGRRLMAQAFRPGLWGRHGRLAWRARRIQSALRLRDPVVRFSL
jgi:hypothetical protein